MIWSRVGCEPGSSTHNQATWYVDAVLGEADRSKANAGEPIDWTLALPNAIVAPINWENLRFSNEPS